MTPDKKEPSDHDLLICLNVKVTELREQFKSHTSRHWAIELALATAVITAIGALIFK